MKFNRESAKTESRQRLIDAATEAFMEEGYSASIDRIAERAGVARQTVYNQFLDKKDLFSEVANRAADTILVPLDGDGTDIRTQLIQLGVGLRQRILGDEGVAIFRTLIAEAPRLPALAQAFFEKGPGRTLVRLTSFIDRAMDDRKLRRDDPQFAAEMLISMLDGFENSRRMLGVSTFPSDEEQNRITQIVDAFLRAYAPERT
ncbi:MAG: TetR/AcrR family transcriptional regulator [Gammaproteobacteria bacterium]|nr:TetR/AcrR family transcriptional regulator [Gammaproteobacteria bacterium]NNL46687.1 TetR/AcrR family transcriptional regulator [Woeseiaceae bacterium]